MRKFISLFAIVVFCQLSFAQLDAFTFSLSSTNETCLGNGSLSFSVANTTPGATMSYAVFLLPNITTPLATVTVNSLTGLNAGDYLVIATQSLDGNSASKQQQAVIANEIVSLTYTLSGVKVRCGNDGQIIVNITSGTALEYQILTGPVTTPYQPSNVFSNLPIGVYGIRVKDSCGDAVVQTFTLEQAIVNLNIGNVSFSDGELPSCDTINIKHAFGVLSNEIIAFPLNFTLTVFPPGGGTPAVFNQTLASGFEINHTIPFYNDQAYLVVIQAIDACGNVYNQANTINQKFNFLATIAQLNCTDLQLSIEPKFYVSPYTVTFLNFPTGFNPINFNANHPGPFSLSEIFYGGANNSLPEGNYTIQLTDACGRTMVKEITLMLSNPSVTGIGINDGCSAEIFISITGGQLLVVNVIDAPSGYAFPIPHDISPLINPDGLTLTLSNIPDGTYTFEILDSCGITHVIIVEILNASFPIIPFQFSSCTLNEGSIGVYTSGSFSNVTLIAAPPSYTTTLPQNLNAFILGSAVFFGSVPEGNYTFEFTHQCGATITETIFIEGYKILTNNFNLTPYCGAFDLFVQHESTAIFDVKFWLQKLNPTTSEWTHPATGAVYVEGSELNATNAIVLQNQTNNLNLAFVGEFRVLKSFVYLENGLEAICIDEVYNFNFTGGPQIIGVTSLFCTNTTNQVIVEAIGAAPLTYSITTKNAQPFVINNGTSNIFTNLEPAIYNFQVTDVCGNIVNSLFDITTLEPFSISATNFCDGENGALTVAFFPFLNYEWWKGSDPTTILSTSSSLDFLPYNAATDFGLYFVKISNADASTACVGAILEFEIPEIPANPNAGNDQTISYCGSQGKINLNTLLTGTFDLNGTWDEITSSGTLSGSTWDSTSILAGTYQFKYTVVAGCDLSDEAIITIIIKDIPIAAIASGDTTICENATLQLFASDVPNVTYQWSGPNNFSSNLQNPVIANVSLLNAGTYTVKTLADGCESLPSSITVVVTPLPQLTAGMDNTVNYCGTPGIINLFDLILGNYDLGGTWQDLSSSGNLNGSVLQTNGLSFGTYQFKYTITGACNFIDESTITIILNEVPVAPIASVDPIACETSDLQLYATTISNAIYMWSGPNGFSSNLQNPVIVNATTQNNGIYLVKAIVNGCESSTSSVTVFINNLPELTIQFECINNVATLTARSLNNSYDEANATYQWTNSFGYSNTTNPAIITNQARGTYTLTITTVSGCVATQTIEVLNTLCTIPNGISPNGDSRNDTFDLSGFSGVLNVQIFNRWGMLVYEKDNYINDWYGQLKNTNTLVPTGTYYYIVNFANSEAKAGWVYLARE